MRLVVLWSSLSGYFSICLKTFVERYGADVLVIVQPPEENTPIGREEFGWIKNYVVYKDASDYRYLRKLVLDFQPDSILMCSWNFRDYMRLVRSNPFRKLPRISGTDNQWRGTVKQLIGKLISPIFLQPSIDGFFVPGDRQVEFCRRLGYDRHRVITGFYSCDVPTFAKVYQSRNISPPPRTFLFVGRMIALKGIRVLAEAYQIYREQVSDPYRLICVGRGPLEKTLSRVDGIEMKGFVPPRNLPEIFAQAGCLLLPSSFEQWGVVVHEATTAGLAVICTHTCGAGVHLVQEDYNGYFVRPGKPQDLTAAMIEYSKKSDLDRMAMSNNSHLLSQQFTPERWASSLYRGFEKIRNRKRYP